ncbi:MAG: signal recognition particle protein [Clostridia bacterium]|nr:signal recognition particle protein [Clostridia bacterium]MBR3591675.1 signal recognition particle protein [Clostridia bacterium]MBR4117085.1 signal recognition particle protein [Clostridia bacterium]
MAFSSLSDKINGVFKKLRNKGRITESDVKDAMREVRLALLEADVNYKVAKEFTTTVAEKCIGANVMESLTAPQMVIKIVNEELTALMGSEQARLKTSSKIPTVIMMCGLQGSGKTTHSAKLAKYLKSKGHRPMLVACDIYRPAAIEQLKVVGRQVETPVFEMGTAKPEKIATEAIKYARDYGHDFVILDTAGRLHIDEELMQELKRITECVEVNNILLVVDSMIGQDAVNIAKSFNEILEIDGIILTKLDGDTRGGAALSVKAVTGKPIMFAGVGEKLDQLEEFHPERMASRILGMGDMLSLIERAEQQLDQKKAEEAAQKLAENRFDMNDLLSQFQQIKKMGSLKSILSMLPGMDKKLRDVDIDDRQMLRIEAIIQSMTAKERAKPDILNASRRRRIAAGCGQTVEDVNRLIKQYEQMKKMFKQMNSKGGRRNLLKGMNPNQFNNLGF